MKRTILPFILLISFLSKAQLTLIPSSVAQIHGFSVGDTFEYREGIGTISCHYEGNILRVINQVNRINDTIFVGYTRVRSGVYTACIPPGNPGEFANRLVFDSIYYVESIAIPDSSIFKYCFNIYDTYLLNNCIQQDSSFKDSVFINGKNSYFGKKQNQAKQGSLSSLDATWVDSLGLTNLALYDESNKLGYGRDLIYYHKSNGEVWGTYDLITKNYHRIFPYSIYDINDEKIISINPNPVKETAQLKISTAEKFEHLHFNISNIIGQTILTGEIKESEATIDTHILIKGLYLINLYNEKGFLVSKKIIKE